MTPPRKRFGQHFLTDPRAIQRIIDAVGVRAGETVVEIGPGRGALTDQLASIATSLVAVEIDRDLAAALTERYAAFPHIRIVCADILDVAIASLASESSTGFAVVGNVPYYITTPILFHALQSPRPRVAVFLVQREVADRLAATPGTAAYGALTVNAQVFAAVEVVATVGAGAFFPKPRVDSAVVRLTPHATPLVSAHHEASFRQLVLALFGQRRKQLTRALRTAANLTADAATAVVAACGVSPSARPEVLSPAQFVALFQALNGRAAPGEAGGAA